MSTSASIGFEENGKDYFTIVRMDGWPQFILPDLFQAIKEKGFDWYKKEIRLAAENGGIEEFGKLFNYPEFDFSYLLHSSGTIDAWAYGEDIGPEGIIRIIFEGTDFLGEL